MTAQPTERDRQRAAEVLRRIGVGLESTTVSIVAQALADERERARAPMLALLERAEKFWAAERSWASQPRHDLIRLDDLRAAVQEEM